MQQRLLQLVSSGALKAPSANDRVFKGECQFCFDTAETDTGLYVNLVSRQAFGAEFVQLDRTRTQAFAYLHLRERRVPKQKPAQAEEAAHTAAPSKLAIGVPGGFAVDEAPFEVEKEAALVLFTGQPGDASAERFAHPSATSALPMVVGSVIDALLAHSDVGVVEAAAAWEDKAPVSGFASSLIQVPNPPRISPSPASWKCALCDKADNLWLNLSDGFIGCGRPNFDGTGGNGHALSHFQATGGLFPLCVKLGTITASGGDVYSYAPDEDDMVEDPHLGAHLAHFGIAVALLSKTERSMAELNVSLNSSYDFSRICESGVELRAVSGPGFMGAENLGNSCYLNSVAQVLCALPETSELYLGGQAAASPASPLLAGSGRVPGDDLLTQLCKLVGGLRHGARYAADAAALAAAKAREQGKKTSAEEEEALAEANAIALSMGGGTAADVDMLTHTSSSPAAAAAAIESGPGTHCGYVVPRSFRSLVGRGHPDFSSSRQQDAIHFLEYLLTQVDKAHRAPGAGARAPPLHGGAVSRLSDVFSYSVERRLQDLATGAVRYSTAPEWFLRLDIPLGEATNKAEVEAAEAAAATAAAAASVAAGAAAGEGEGASKRARATPPPTASATLPKRLVPFAACLQRWAATSLIEDWASPETGAKGNASSALRFRTTPRYLVVQLNRYTMAADWTTVKVDAEVPVPLELDLEGPAAGASGAAGCLRGRGLQPGEVEMQDRVPAAGAAAPLLPSPELVASLEGMGFPLGACARAAMAVANAGMEPAMEWMLQHMEDEGFADPFLPPAAAASAAAPAAAAADPAAVAMLGDMGFSPERAAAALRATGGDLERATDWLFSHAEEEDAPAAAASSAAATAPAAAGDAAAAARGEYDLVGFISHMGRNTDSGHYVAHIRKLPDGSLPARGMAGTAWYIFNDRKVAVSADPPLALGYIYVFRRRD